MEIFKDIKDYEGLYKVSNYGRIKSITRLKKNKSRLQNVKSIIKSTRYNNNDYEIVDLSKNGKIKTLYVHRLVAIAFIKNEYNKPEVNHIDGNKNNNNLSNLEWVTSSENIKHAFDNKLHKGSKCKVSKNSKSGIVNINPKFINGMFKWNVCLRTKNKRYEKSTKNIYDAIVWYNSILRSNKLEDNIIQIDNDIIKRYGNGLCCYLR